VGWKEVSELGVFSMVSAGVKIVPSRNLRLGARQRQPDERTSNRPEVVPEAGGRSAKGRLRAKGVLFHGKRVRGGGQTGERQTRLCKTKGPPLEVSGDAVFSHNASIVELFAGNSGGGGSELRTILPKPRSGASGSPKLPQNVGRRRGTVA